jgi:hypothetical protein
MRIFFAHPKSMEDGDIDWWVGEISRIFDGAADTKPDVTTGRDDFKRYALGAGSFTSWAREVPIRKDMSTGKRFYEVFVSVNAYIGRATADILRGALHIGTPVIFLEQDEEKQAIEPRRVTQVVVVDADDYLKGWYLDT